MPEDGFPNLALNHRINDYGYKRPDDLGKDDIDVEGQHKGNHESHYNNHGHGRGHLVGRAGLCLQKSLAALLKRVVSFHITPEL